MIWMFVYIVAGIAIGVAGSILVAAGIRWRDEEQPEGDLDYLMREITPVETPFLSEIERHRAAHLSIRREENDRSD